MDSHPVQVVDAGRPLSCVFWPGDFSHQVAPCPYPIRCSYSTPLHTQPLRWLATTQHLIGVPSPLSRGSSGICLIKRQGCRIDTIILGILWESTRQQGAEEQLHSMKAILYIHLSCSFLYSPGLPPCGGLLRVRLASPTVIQLHCIQWLDYRYACFLAARLFTSHLLGRASTNLCALILFCYVPNQRRQAPQHTSPSARG